jgi:hypothetical protein
MKNTFKVLAVFLLVAAVAIVATGTVRTGTATKVKSTAVGSTTPDLKPVKLPHAHGSWHFTGGKAVHYISGGSTYGVSDDTLLETTDPVSVPVDSDPATLTVTYTLDLADAGDTVDVLVDGDVEFTFDDSMNTDTQTDEDIDLTDYEGDDVVIGFHFTSDASGTGEGMTIYNVTLSGECEVDIFAEDFSSWPPDDWYITPYSSYADWHQCTDYPSTAPSAGIGWDGTYSSQADLMFSPEIDCSDWENVLCDYRYMSSYFYDMIESDFYIIAYSYDGGNLDYHHYGGQEYGDTEVTDWDLSDIYDGNEENVIWIYGFTSASYYDYDWFVFDEFSVHAEGTVVSFDDSMDDDSNWTVTDGDYTTILPASVGKIKSLYH